MSFSTCIFIMMHAITSLRLKLGRSLAENSYGCWKILCWNCVWPWFWPWTLWLQKTTYKNTAERAAKSGMNFLHLWILSICCHAFLHSWWCHYDLTEGGMNLQFHGLSLLQWGRVFRKTMVHVLSRSSHTRFWYRYEAWNPPSKI